MVSMLGREFVLQRAWSPSPISTISCSSTARHSLGLLTVNAMAAADSVMVPISASTTPLEGLSQPMNTVKLVKKHINPKIEVEGVVLTMYDAHQALGPGGRGGAQFFPGQGVQERHPAQRAWGGPSHGLPIHLYDPSARGGGLQALAREILAANGGTQAEKGMKAWARAWARCCPRMC